MGFEVGTCFVCRGFGVQVFELFCKNAFVGDDYFANSDELCFFFGGVLGFVHLGVI